MTHKDCFQVSLAESWGNISSRRVVPHALSAPRLSSKGTSMRQQAVLEEEEEWLAV